MADCNCDPATARGSGTQQARRHFADHLDRKTKPNLLLSLVDRQNHTLTVLRRLEPKSDHVRFRRHIPYLPLLLTSGEQVLAGLRHPGKINRPLLSSRPEPQADKGAEGAEENPRIGEHVAALGLGDEPADREPIKIPIQMDACIGQIINPSGGTAPN
ncbi:hypothetical protein JQ615_36395 [Bradyrhizobium jicamae]|uniref:Uncharacterized protein n=1 Tax=Bradyrhizobium jicamae TaxID=280332 RepID=A0ABS5FVI9_9BRAD|nr:hypothetical protein [Bradyrhizobium jicamae]MBR0800856.1 hypothetical protein [Bradyrhizobium jicamae]